MERQVGRPGPDRLRGGSRMNGMSFPDTRGETKPPRNLDARGTKTSGAPKNRLPLLDQELAFLFLRTLFLTLLIRQFREIKLRGLINVYYNNESSKLELVFSRRKRRGVDDFETILRLRIRGF